MDVTKLVMEMQDTLSTIRTTLASLNTSEHDAKLDELELKRDNTIKKLLNDFSAESEVLTQQRKAERDEIAERRRREDEEREIRRRLEDEELAARDHKEDEVRDGKLLAQTNVVEEETDNLMIQIEEEAQRVIEEGHRKLKALEEKRQELNRLIDEQLKAPLPQMPRRRSRRGSSMPPAMAVHSKLPESMSTPESINNSENKAFELQNKSENDGSRAVTNEVDSVQSIPQTVADQDAMEEESGPNDAHQIERHLRPLLVHPVISKSGDIIHTEEQPEKKPPVEPIGIPALDLAASEIAQEPKRDVTWWEEKRKAEAQALQAEKDALERAVQDETLAHAQDGEGQAEQPATAQHAASEEQEILHATVFDGNLDQMKSYKYADEQYIESSEGTKTSENGPPPADIPLLSSAGRGSISSIEGDTSFESAHSHMHHEPNVPSAISDHTKSHDNDHVLFANDRLDHHHDSYQEYDSRDASVLRTEHSATPGREFSSETDEHEIYSVSSHDNREHEQQQAPDLIVREAAKVALPPEIEDSCSISESSDHPSDVEMDVKDSLKHRHPGITDVGDVDEQEAIISLERIPSHQPGPELDNREPQEAKHGVELSLPPQTVEDLELKSPLLMPIPENEEVHHRMDDNFLESPPHEQVGLGIRDNQPAPGSLQQDDDHDEGSDDDSVSHHHFDEDDYMHPDSHVSVQPFRTDRSDRGSLTGDGAVQDLKDSVGGPDKRDAESDRSDRRSVGDHTDHSVLPWTVGVGSEGRKELEADSQDALQEVESNEVMAEAQSESRAEHEETADVQIANMPSPIREGNPASSDSEENRREEDMAQTPVVPSQDSELQNTQGEAHSTMAEGPVAMSSAPSKKSDPQPEEVKAEMGPVSTDPQSEPHSLYDDAEYRLSTHEQHRQLGMEDQMAQQPLHSLEMHSPAPVYPVNENLADQLRRASREDESENYDDDESSLLERTDEYTTTVHGEAVLFDDDGDEASDYGEEKYDDEGVRDNDGRSPTAHLAREMQALGQAAQVYLDASRSEAPPEQFSADPETLAQTAEADVELSQDVHAPSPASFSARDQLVQPEEALGGESQSLPQPPVNEPFSQKDGNGLETDTVAVPSTRDVQTSVQAEEAHLDQVQGHLTAHTVCPSLEPRQQGPDGELQVSHVADPDLPHPAATHAEDMADEPELPQSAAPISALEIPKSQDEAPRRRSWVEETDEFFDESDKEQQQNAGTSLMRPSSAEKSLAASRHDPNRPQTPEQEQEYSADRTNTSWHAHNSSSPQSMRSGSTLSSAPSSPAQTRDIHDPVIRGLDSTEAPSYTGRPRNDSSLTEYSARPRNDSSLSDYNPHESPEPQPKTHFSPGPLASRWGPSGHLFDRDRDSHRKSDVGSGGGSLFQRMRSVFEPTGTQPDSGYNNPPRASWTGVGKRSSSRHSRDEDNIYGHERTRSGLLGNDEGYHHEN